MSDSNHEFARAKICLESITDKLSSLSSDTPSYGRVCIYKVPDKHRSKNPEAYTPRLVSIGLIHYGENQVQTMEENKLKYLSNFMHTFRVDLKELVEYVCEVEKLVCFCYGDVYARYVSENKSKAEYEDTVRYVSGNKPKVPSEVILLDGIFILELFLKNHFVELRENEDMIFDNSWISNEILHDLLLFENQLPFRFLYELYEKFVLNRVGKWLGDESVHPPSFDELTHKYFKDVGNTGKLLLRKNARSAKHFVEFLSILHKPYENDFDDKERTKVDHIKENGKAKSGSTKKGILHKSSQMLFTKCPILPKSYDQEKQSIKVQKKGKAESRLDYTKCPTTTNLQAAGVQFTKGTTNCLLDVNFDVIKGELQIPQLIVNDSTETFLRNLIAYEQSGCYMKYATSLVIFLDSLIDTSKDVDILVDHEIIRNELGSSKQVADLFNNIYKELMPDPKEFYFIKECRQLNAYSRNWWHKIIAAATGWFVMLQRDYFSSPWSIISVIAAFIALVLTAIQTAYAIKG